MGGLLSVWMNDVVFLEALPNILAKIGIHVKQKTEPLREITSSSVL
jgi:hypothetical protein